MHLQCLPLPIHSKFPLSPAFSDFRASACAVVSAGGSLPNSDTVSESALHYHQFPPLPLSPLPICGSPIYALSLLPGSSHHPVSTRTIPRTYWTLNKHSMKGRMKGYQFKSLSQGVSQPTDSKQITYNSFLFYLVLLATELFLCPKALLPQSPEGLLARGSCGCSACQILPNHPSPLAGERASHRPEFGHWLCPIFP